MKKRLLACTLGLAALALPCASAWAQSEDFDRGGEWSCVEDAVKRSPDIKVGDFGDAKSKGIQVSYVGFERGSRRVSFRCPVATPGPEYTLQYNVRFGDDFQFVKGGKLPGLGPEKPMTGGHGVRADGWSVRPMFLTNGGLNAYVYHQDQPKNIGDPMRAEGFAFEKSRYYRITIYVKVNSAPDKRDGVVKMYVDDRVFVDRANVRFRAVDGKQANVASFLFSTFHGGEGADWAPRDPAGKFTTVHADFDNFIVYPGPPRLSRP